MGIPDGYAGKLLIIDLTHESIVQEELQVDDIRRFIGGSGLGAKILFHETVCSKFNGYSFTNRNLREHPKGRT